jgi:cell division protein FtsI (penicillin-binding protein 3)
MVNQPTFNPNDRGQSTPAMFRNRAATDILEPGSSIKPFVVAAALQSGRFDASSVLDTTLVKVGSKIIMDEHPHGSLGLAQILALSSNVGMTKIALALEPQQLWTTLTQLGFGHVTASGFPGESAGVLSNYGSWRPSGIASLSYGYGLSVTPLQLAHAYAAVGALGVARPVSMLKIDGSVPGERVLSEQHARTLIALLESVVAEGTGTKAAIAGYRVAGKTGTAQKNSGGNYFDDRHTATFGGIAPATQPRLAAVVVIDDPAAGRYYGGDVAAPVFSAVVGGALRLMGVAPDAVAGPAADPLTGVTTVVRR